jgi:hypothetical protein
MRCTWCLGLAALVACDGLGSVERTPAPGGSSAGATGTAGTGGVSAAAGSGGSTAGTAGSLAEMGGHVGTLSSCHETVTDHCADLPCVREWPADPQAFCAMASADTTEASLQVGCGTYDVFAHSTVDTTDLYYYSTSTGELYAVVQLWNDLLHCEAGPSDFRYPSACSVTPTPVDCAAAGGAGGAAVSAGAGGA